MWKIISEHGATGFEGTVRRHQTRAKCEEFGEKALRRWWKEKDSADILRESRITEDKDKESIVREIYDAVVGDKR